MTTAIEIAEKFASEQNLTKVQAKAAVDAVFQAITEAALTGAETSIPNFGKIKVKATPECEGRNPANSK
jgi:DNA-binding protein HU-beta